MKRIVLALVLAACATVVQAAPSAFGSAYSRDAGCRRTGQGAEGQDWVSYRCDGYGARHVWVLFVDSARMRLGFGGREHYAGTFPLDAQIGRTVEWRGRMVRGRLEPFAAIARVGSWEGGTVLAVFRLTGDRSCYIGEARDNAGARALADAAADRYRCLGTFVTP